MKIAILGSTLYPAPSEKGKIHAPIKLIFDLANGLADKGHEVTFFGLISPDVKGIISSGLKIEDKYCKQPEDTNNRDKFLKIAFEQTFFRKVIENEAEKFDIIYTHIYLVSNFAVLTEKPVVFTHHDSTRSKDYGDIFDFSKQPNLSIVAVSDYLVTLYKHDTFGAVIHHGVKIDKFVEQPENYYVWAGRISEPKGLHIAIDLAIKHGFKLKFAGPGGVHGGLGNTSEYWETIRNKIVGHSNIEYFGTLSQDETYDLVSKAKAFIFPTDGTESFSMVVAESMVMGTPVIAFNKGPMPELIVPGKTGLLCNDIGEIEDAIENIDKIDRQECRDVASKNLSVDKMVNGYEKYFLDLLGK